MDMAATLRGCVQAIHRMFPPTKDVGGHNKGSKNCGIWVVFPEPVSPDEIIRQKDNFFFDN